jgi:putative DNA primase/helicase
MVTELIDLEKKSRKMDFEKIKRQIELHLLSPEKGSSQIAIDLASSYILSDNHIKCIRQDDNDEFWIYREGIYLPEGKSYIIEMCDQLFHVAYTPQKSNNVCAKIKAKTFIELNTFFSQQNSYPYLIAVNNGVLNLKTKELTSFSHEYYFFNKLNMNYNPDAKCPIFNEFVSQITANDNDVKVIQEIFGFSMVKDYVYEKAFMLYGDGRNGKSKLMDVLKVFVGDDNVSSVSLVEIEKKPFAICNLQNKLVNIASDISNEAIGFTGNFKRLTGRDTVSADRKNKSYVNFKNYAKMIFAANELPPVNTLSSAFWLRWIIIEFPYQFLPKKEIEALPLNKRGGVFLQNPEIIDNLITPQEMEGLLLWSIEGLHRLIKNKDFSNKETANDNHVNWLRRSNSVTAFLFDEVDEEPDFKVSKNDFKKRYLSYCRSNNIKTLNDKVIKRTIESETGATDIRVNENVEGFGYTKVSYWEGIRFRDVNLILSSAVDEGEVTKLVHPEEFVI